MGRATSFAKCPLAWILVLVVVLSTVPAAFASEGYGPGRVGLEILAGRDHVYAGSGGIWNSRDQLHIQLDPELGWRIKSYKIDLGSGEDYSPPLTTTGNPKIGHFDYKECFDLPYMNEANEDGHAFRQTLILDLETDLEFQWGSPWNEQRTQGAAIFLELVKLDDNMNVIEQTGAWVVPELLVWLDTAEDSIELQDEFIADGITGEIIEDGVMEIKTTKKGKVLKKEHKKAQKNWEVDEAEDIVAFDGGRWGWWFSYTMGHPRTGHFIDSPVAGLFIETPTYEGTTDLTASFDFFPGEEVDISLGSVLLGSTVADQKISPLDIFDPADTEDPRVINMARLLQSLDSDGDPQGTIDITAEVLAAFQQAMASWNLTELDFSDDYMVSNIIDQTVFFAAQQDPSILLVTQSAEDAKAHLDDTLNNSMFRKNISKTPELGSSKAKMNISTMWFDARRANNDLLTEIGEAIEYYDEDGNLIRTTTKAKPVVVTYTDEDPTTGAPDVWAAISRDDGETWKRKNLSRSGDLSSFETSDGKTYYGECKKPVFQVKSNKILVAWSSKYARGGKPRFAIDLEDDYVYDDPYYTDDIWGVGGPQLSHDYTEDGYPEVGEVPYSVLWVCRGVIASGTDVTNGIGEFVGDIVWFKPERLTSGRRDVNQIFVGAGSGAGFAMVWQEDPEGLRPGRAVGPGPGWGGATTAHKTDIWYSYLGWGDHTKVDANFVTGGDPEHDLDHIERPKALVPMSLPLRLTDNDVLNMKNMGLDETTTADAITFNEENLTRCVKFEGGKTIVEPDSPDAGTADYAVLRAVPEDHYASMNCTNCHVPFATDPMGVTPTQGAPIPLVVLDAENKDYLGGFTNGDCVSCHYSNIVPRDRVIAVTPGLDEESKCAECEGARGGIWKDGTQEGGEVLEAYYPYAGYPYLPDDSDTNDGTHRYGLEVEGLLSGDYYTFINNSGNETSVAITTDGRLMDGDTGASRGNIFLQPYTATKPDGTTYTSAWAIITYEETKGAGSGPPETTGSGDEDGNGNSDAYIPESGKNVIYHSFDFKNPDLVSGGQIMNRPEFDVDGNLVYLVDENGGEILDYLGRPQLAYENSRRGRFILQGWGAVRSSRTIMLMVMKMGEEGSGRPSDIMMQRWEIPEDEITFKYKDSKIVGVVSVEGNPYRFENIIGDYVLDPVSEQYYWASGPVNMSSVTPTVTTDSAGDPEVEDAYGAVKVVEWVQTVDNLDDPTWLNRYDDARAHRGQIRGNFVQLGFSYTPNWAAARNGHDNYDFYIRRSFNGGKTWTTDPNGSGVEHCRTWTYPSGTQDAGTKVEECATYAAGAFEAMRNLSQLPNNKESVIEPRIVAVPGTIKKDGVWTGIAEDKQNPNVFYVAWGTSDNPIKDPITKEQDEPAPADLFWSVSVDKGETYYEDVWYVNGTPTTPDVTTGDEMIGFPWMAKGDQEQGEVQLRETPDGTRFYASWLDEGEEGSDIVFRRIMPPVFPANVASTAATMVVTEPEDETDADTDFTSDSGGDDSE